MPNRLLFSVRYFSKVFKKYLKVSFSLIIFLTILRFNVFFLSVSAWLKDSSFAEVFLAFFTGLRFDILVYGFLLIPALIFWWLITLSIQWKPWAVALTHWWFRLTWLAVCLLQVVDFMQFHTNGVRIRAVEFESLFGGWLSQIWPQVSLIPFLVFTAVAAIIWTLGAWVLRQVELGDWKDEYSPIRGGAKEILWRLIWPLFVVGLMARGTLEEHHLRYEHSLISNDTRLNEMALNPMWTLDK